GSGSARCISSPRTGAAFKLRREAASRCRPAFRGKESDKPPPLATGWPTILLIDGRLYVTPMLNVTLRRMEVFVAIVDEGSFAAAADRFGIAQPSVSAHIRALERDVGGEVFARRRGRRPVLTELGRSVLSH